MLNTIARKTATTGYEAATRRIERKIAGEQVLQRATVPGKVRIQPHAESLLSHRPDAKGTVLMFHGFTAGPWQYEELANRLQKEGYNVYAPRLPGHGMATPDGKITGDHFIEAHNRAKYDDYVKARFAEAEAFGKPVWVAGLSGGANVALRTAQLYPQVKGVFDMAPFLGSDGSKSLVFKLIAGIDRMTFGLFGKLLDHVQRGKNGMVDPKNLMPHAQPSYGATLAIRDLGVRAKGIDAPIQFVTTEGDLLSGKGFVKALFERTGGAKENAWYHFPAEAGVKHAMISPKQNTVPGAVDTLTDMLVNFLKTGKTVQRPPVSV